VGGVSLEGEVARGEERNDMEGINRGTTVNYCPKGTVTLSIGIGPEHIKVRGVHGKIS